ncbi:SLC13 family permease [Novosphingobium sp. ERN07]|uniref:SLC13 family permease n=1 Tax=Novosphingobium sp. ERN07 TaxID=2726187 RepID=UPI0014566C07|nr:SLC13 family permease [Novosphingobium sp. ERN07]NLR70509.1 SLC13 family permease [Novosphingobium sp. ERN07]
MTQPQWLSLATLGGMMALFLWGRFRYDVTAVIALLVAVAIGVVSPKAAFTGFSDDIVVIVGSALVLSAAVQRSGVIERLLQSLAQRIKRPQGQMLVLSAAVGVASGFIKNVGALAMLMPGAVQMARKNQASPSLYLMPMAFASLLGGLTTLIGTSPNIIVSRVREEMTGEPFRMFDYLPTGLALLAVGLVFLSFGWRLLPTNRNAAQGMDEAINISSYVIEATVSEGSPVAGLTVDAFRERHEGEIEVTGLVRGDMRGAVDHATHIHEGDVLILSGEPNTLERVVGAERLVLGGDDDQSVNVDSLGVIEAVIHADSALIGRTARRLQMRDRLGINLIAISREGETIASKPGNTVLQAGDVIVLQGPLETMPARLSEMGALPLAQRKIGLGSRKSRWLPLIILAAAMVAAGSGFMPAALAFFAAAGLTVITGALPVDEAYKAIEWPILIMLAALIPVSESLQTTGASDVIAKLLADLAVQLPAWGAVALILVAAMAVTPFLNNAATVLVMAPIAAVFAEQLHYRPEAFLIATAVGAGCDFLTPIGHQCNTLVLGPGGYRFGDYARLGAPLSVLVVTIGTPLILWAWPL